MLKATSSRNGGCQVEGEGSIMEQLNDLPNIIISGVAEGVRFAPTKWEPKEEQDD